MHRNIADVPAGTIIKNYVTIKDASKFVTNVFWPYFTMLLNCRRTWPGGQHFENVVICSFYVHTVTVRFLQFIHKNHSRFPGGQTNKKLCDCKKNIKTCDKCFLAILYFTMLINCRRTLPGGQHFENVVICSFYGHTVTVRFLQFMHRNIADVPAGTLIKNYVTKIHQNLWQMHFGHILPCC